MPRTKKSIKFQSKSPEKTYKRRRKQFFKKLKQHRAIIHKKNRTRNMRQLKKNNRSRRSRARVTISSKNTYYEYNKKEPSDQINVSMVDD